MLMPKSLRISNQIEDTSKRLVKAQNNGIEGRNQLLASTPPLGYSYRLMGGETVRD